LIFMQKTQIERPSLNSARLALFDQQFGLAALRRLNPNEFVEPGVVEMLSRRGNVEYEGKRYSLKLFGQYLPVEGDIVIHASLGFNGEQLKSGVRAYHPPFDWNRRTDGTYELIPTDYGARIIHFGKHFKSVFQDLNEILDKEGAGKTEIWAQVSEFVDSDLYYSSGNCGRYVSIDRIIGDRIADCLDFGLVLGMMVKTIQDRQGVSGRERLRVVQGLLSDRYYSTNPVLDCTDSGHTWVRDGNGYVYDPLWGTAGKPSRDLSLIPEKVSVDSYGGKTALWQVSELSVDQGANKWKEGRFHYDIYSASSSPSRFSPRLAYFEVKDVAQTFIVLVREK
jgi:hypothetical protein